MTAADEIAACQAAWRWENWGTTEGGRMMANGHANDDALKQSAAKLSSGVAESKQAMQCSQSVSQSVSQARREVQRN
jgi:hypothetical protein